jgi:hypothetical protein
MTAQTTLQGVGPVAVRHSLHTTSLARFLPRYRPRVIALADRDPRVADLALSFPALLFALAVPRPRLDSEPVIASILAGDSLKTLAVKAQLPMWSRKLPPEAFDQPLRPLPHADLVARSIGNHLPRKAKQGARWLNAVSTVAQCGTPEAAVWVAREFNTSPKEWWTRDLRKVALYAWFSQHQQTKAGSLLAKPWTPSMSFATAKENATDWLTSVAVETQLGGLEVFDVWLKPTVVDGLEFLPLRSAAEICDEAEAMQNCLRNYGRSIACGHERIWSIRRNGERVATLELNYSSTRLFPLIGQLVGPKNCRVDIAVERTAWSWVLAHDLNAIEPPERKPYRTTPDLANWHAVWRPYWLAKQTIPAWLPMRPDNYVIDNI